MMEYYAAFICVYKCTCVCRCAVMCVCECEGQRSTLDITIPQELSPGPGLSRSLTGTWGSPLG